MAERTVVIASKAGLHARPAALFTQAAARSGLVVRIAKGAQGPVDAASILQVMTLGAALGDTVTVSVEGPDEDRVLDELVTMLATDLDAVQS
ncbi:MAG: HPr family phosphocarrier protein [Cellulomonas sp.]|uniref:HPr family phosphocarrier protein n=1 Tax=Cellulomonas sp. TaxID=40001 RepID=UPI0017AA8B90|nr:HPr family phosphocarrier protein [Cellulomonas sp.]NMM16274.1 HPr family phosphocarrier protein [Cellulomonas sp.]NMM31839.1 HPr family phosphocarrier protein [Cellulomonas sp.]